MRRMSSENWTKDKETSRKTINLKNRRPRSIQELNSKRFRQSLVEQLSKRPATTEKQSGLVQSERISVQNEELLSSGDSITYFSTAYDTRRSIDIVADIHNENKELEFNSIAYHLKNEIPKKSTMQQTAGNERLFYLRNASEDKNISYSAKRDPNSKVNTENGNRSFEERTARETEDSLDAIKEFEETTKILTCTAKSTPGESIKMPLQLSGTHDSKYSLKDSNSEESYPQFLESNEKFIKTSRENLEVEQASERMTDDRLIEKPKRRRKQWLKEERNIHLTQELIANSSDKNSTPIESDSRFSTDRSIRPIPAPWKKKYLKYSTPDSNLGFDNAAFRSDPEEVLRIETEVYNPEGISDSSQKYRQNTKIKITKLYDSCDEVGAKNIKLYDSEDEFSDSWGSQDNEKKKKIKSFKVLDSINTSDDPENHDSETKRCKSSQILITPMKNGKQLVAGSKFKTSEIVNQGLNPNRLIKKCQHEKMTRINRLSTKIDSASFDTDNSPTNTSDLLRSKSQKEHFQRRSTHSKQKESKSTVCTRKHKSRNRMKSNKNKLSTLNDKDDLIECNADKIERLISITIHKADLLETDFITRHPMVKVHIVDMNTENYLRTTHSDNNGRCSYLQPIITGKFDFKENKSIVPNWEEELIFEYSFDEIIKASDKPILILFEILDTLNSAEASFNYKAWGSEGCWHKIAWAFLRPVGLNGKLHINKKLRLQLYKPPKTSKKSKNFSKCEVVNWWKSPNREKYSSILYVTLKAIEQPVEDPIVYEHLSLNYSQELENEYPDSFKKSSDLLQLSKWDRLASQSCKIPNNHLFQSKTFENGCFYVAFGHNGKYLACVGSEEDNYPIFVYMACKIPDGKIYVEFVGHRNFVYGLNWSNDDKYLLSVSSDQTACIWDVENKIIQYIEMLPHPSYIYCGKFYPGNKHVIVTGCHDCVTRVWAKSKSRRRYELMQELDEHKGYINSLCFQKNGDLITADSTGVIILWSLKKKGSSISAREWYYLKTIKNTEIKDTVINTIILHPLGSRLLVHSRNDGLRMIDLATGIVLQRYKGLRNRRLQITACLSPCGGLVICGGEDSYLTFWNLENGKQIAKYQIPNSKVIACVAYHPLDHILAFSIFGSGSAVQIMNFDKQNQLGQNVGLISLEDSKDFMSDDYVEITMKFDRNDKELSDLSKGKWHRKLDVQYFGTKPANIVRGERLGSNYRKTATDENSLSRQELLRLKIQRLSDSQNSLKSRSAARLNNIIEKIDKILINTSTRDFDLTCSSSDARKKDFGQMMMSNSEKDICSKNEDRRSLRSQRSKSKDKSSMSNTDATMELRNTTSTEFIEMRNISSIRCETSENEELAHSKVKHTRLKNCANISLYSDVEYNEDYSDHSISGFVQGISKENRSHEISESEIESNHEKKRHFSLLDNKYVPKSGQCIIALHNSDESSPNSPSTSDSFGTYTIDRSTFSKPSVSDRSKTVDTSNSSVKSTATFTIENEISTTVPESVKRKIKKGDTK